MGNRAVITTEENYKNNGIGIYLHWNGGRDSVEAFLAYCKAKGYREPEWDNYGWSYLTTIIGNYFGDGLAIGVDTVNSLDCDNGDNGVYFIKDWKIVGRECFNRAEQKNYDFYYMLDDINERQPEHIRMTKDEIIAIPKPM